MGTEHYCLRWNNHQSNLLGVFSQLLRDESLVDVTLSCSEGHSIRAHKVVLSACSSYFQSLFIDHPSRHPIVILKDVHFSELRTLIEFMYKGEVNVEYRQLSALLKTAESLKVKGLTEMTALSNLYNEDDHGHGHSHEHETIPMPMDHNTTIIPTIKMEQSEVEHNQSIPESASILPLITPLVRYSESSDRPPSSIEGSVKSFDCSRPESPEKLSQTTIPLSNVNIATNPDEKRNENFLHGNNTHKQSNASVNDHGHGHNHGHHQNDDIVDEEDEDDDDDDDDFDTTRTPIHTTTTSTTTMSSKVTNSSTDRMLLNQPVAGPSGLAPIQNVPLSLKKENNWSSSSHNEEKPNNLSGIRTPTNQLSDTDNIVTSDGSIPLRQLMNSGSHYPCIYCGLSFQQQNKLTRHILSHSLDSLKFRDQFQKQNRKQAVITSTSNPAMTSISHDSNYYHENCQHLQYSMDFETNTIPNNVVNSNTALMEGQNIVSTQTATATVAASSSPSSLQSASATTSQSNFTVCKFCGKSFSDVSTLITHLPVHTGDRPFKCEFCGKAFKLRHHMKDHSRVHTGERPFRCSLCGKTFSRSTILKAHEKTHYPKFARRFLSPSPLDLDEDNPH